MKKSYWKCPGTSTCARDMAKNLDDQQGTIIFFLYSLSLVPVYLIYCQGASSKIEGARYAICHTFGHLGLETVSS